MTTTLLLGGVNVAKIKKEIVKLAKQLISQLILVSILLVLIPSGVIAAPEQVSPPLLPYTPDTSAINFSTDQPDPLILIDDPKLTFRIGESRADESARLAAEQARAAAAQKTISKTKTVARLKITVTTTPEPDFSAKRALAQAAAAAYGIPWQILEAVWQVESGKSWDTHRRSPAGAQGPAQFMPATWRRYGVDGNGDGVADINSAVDAIHGAAHYLAANGAASGDIYRALYAYNHADWYVQKVLKIAREIGYTG